MKTMAAYQFWLNIYIIYNILHILYIYIYIYIIYLYYIYMIDVIYRYYIYDGLLDLISEKLYSFFYISVLEIFAKDIFFCI